MKKLFYLLALLFIINNTCWAQSKEEAIIRNTMNDQLAAWNTGDIDRFMVPYWQSDSLMLLVKAVLPMAGKIH